MIIINDNHSPLIKLNVYILYNICNNVKKVNIQFISFYGVFVINSLSYFIQYGIKSS